MLFCYHVGYLELRTVARHKVPGTWYSYIRRAAFGSSPALRQSHGTGDAESEVEAKEGLQPPEYLVWPPEYPLLQLFLERYHETIFPGV